jgi:hypothetical protein
MSLEHCSRLVPGRRALRRALLLSHTHSLKSTKTEIPMPTSLRICSAHCWSAIWLSELIHTMWRQLKSSAGNLLQVLLLMISNVSRIGHCSV